MDTQSQKGPPILRPSVREVRESDIDSINRYWRELDAESLERMGCDKTCFPSDEENRKNLLTIINDSIRRRTTDYAIWEIDGQPVGFSSLKSIIFGQTGEIHLHMWKAQSRQRGTGTLLFQLSLEYYLEKYHLKKLICEPSSKNLAPNRVLSKLGHQVAKTYVTKPSEIACELEVNRYEITAQNALGSKRPMVYLKGFCDSWLRAWTGNRPLGLLEFYSESCVYRDPAHPQKLKGKAELANYLEKLLRKNPSWVWEAKEIIPTDKGFVLLWNATLPEDRQAEGLDIVEMHSGLITRNEVYFDPGTL